ncbi:MAG TPA: M1 family metallopeptidase [Myxococcota bacterium]|nr:M1 family metallopeptidase [Myxococcota bacterium]
MRPLEVAVHVEVDPSNGPAFSGEVSQRLRIARPTRSIELHAADLRVARPRLAVGGQLRRGKLVAHPDVERIEVVFAEPVPAGEAVLELAFAGKLRSDLRGLYAARAGEREYALTQLEAADARRFFPCFDEPSFKARFQLSVTTGTRNTVLSNEPVAKVEPLGGGRKTVHFEPTPPLSTYLLALAVGELEASEPVRCGETEIRVWHVPGKGALTGFALEAARECLARLEAYFDLPYPYAKLDLVAAPDFEAGAMENAGAVFFRETLLLVDPETVTLQEKKRVAEVVCHELAHMWYGDLVTMEWWNDLWLNEAFATWMAFHVVDAWKPEWKMWNDFQHHRAAAFSLDALANTHPIYTEVRTPSDATENFDAITYEKGASVVRMVERFLGAEAFRAGVRAYIREHQESNAVAADLWRALSESSGRDVEPIVRPWIETPGFPLVSLRRARAKGTAALGFSQERFRMEGGAGGRRKADPTWPIPWVGRLGRPDGGTRLERELLERKRAVLPLSGGEARFVYGNADEGGFFRPLHDADELALLAAHRGSLSAVERMGLLSHQWAAVRAGRAPLASFLDLALAFGDERDPDVLTTLRGPLAFCVDRLGREAGPDAQVALRSRIAAAFRPAFEALGFDAGARDDDDARLRRAALLSLVAEVAEDPAVTSAATARFERYLADRKSLEPNLADPVVALGARTGDAARFDALLAAATSARTPQERRRMLMALGEFRDRAQSERALGLTLTDAVGTQDVAILLTRMLGNPAAREATWAFLKSRFAKLRKRLPPMLASRPIEALPALGTRAARRDVAAFFRAHPLPTAARAVKQALERFDLDAALAQRAVPELRRWLGLPPPSPAKRAARRRAR